MKISHREEAEVEEQLIRVLGEGHNQWTYRPDLKSEEDLWVNLRQKIISNNQAELNDSPLTDKEFETIKTELLLRTKTPFDAAKWLKGENGMARITIEREDPQLGSVSLILYSNQDIGGGISTYEVVHQIAKRGSNIEARDRRFDVTLLINGLPMVFIRRLTKSKNMQKKVCFGTISFRPYSCLWFPMNKPLGILQMPYQRICILSFYLVGERKIIKR